MGLQKAATSFLVSHRRPVPLPSRPSRQRQNSASAPSSPAVVRNSPPASILGRPYRSLKAKYIVGAGRAGECRRCRLRHTDAELACKTILKNRLMSDADVEAVRESVEAHMCVSNHEGVVAVLDVLEDEEALHVITESCEGGQLSERIRRRGRYLEKDAAFLCASLLRSVLHCHTCGVTHRGIRPETIMLTSAESDTCVKLGDFGHATFFRPNEKMTRVVGTSHYQAPEVLQKSYHGAEADMWCVGVTLYVVLSGSPPFWAGNVDNLEDDTWADVTRPARDLLRRMLCSDPTARITAKEALDHPWIRMHCESVHLESSKPLIHYASASNAKGLYVFHRTPRCLSTTSSSPPSPPSLPDEYDSECSSKSSSSTDSFEIPPNSFHFSPVNQIKPVPNFSEMYSKPSGLPPINTSKKIKPRTSTLSQKSYSPSSSAGSTPFSLKDHSFGSPRHLICFGSLSVGDFVAVLSEKIKNIEENCPQTGKGLENCTYVVEFNNFSAVVDYNQREKKFGISWS